jgi:hypothetical protein
MMETNNEHGYIIAVDSLAEGCTAVQRGADGMPVVYETRIEAERDVVQDFITRLQEFLRGERAFDDATFLEDCILEVTRNANGSLEDDYGRKYV